MDELSSTTSSILELQSNEEVNKRGRKRKYFDYNSRRRVNMIPRLLKRDIRRDLALMYFHTFNSCDCQYVSKFLTRFCTPDCSFRVSHTINSPPYYNDVVKLSTIGIEAKLLSYKFLISQFPDICSFLSNIEVIQRSNVSYIELRCHIKMKGTNPVALRHDNSHNHTENNNQMIPSKKIVEFENITLNSHPHELNRFSQYLNHLPSFSIDDQISLLINEQGYIFDMFKHSSN